MTKRELIELLESLGDDDTEVVIGMIQKYGSNFAMEICEVKEHKVNSWYDDNCKAIVITQGSQLGTVNYDEYDEEEF